MQKFKTINRWIIILVLVSSFLGFADATYLSVLHFNNQVPPCSILQGCEKVTSSQYSVIFGVPLALLGAVYYLMLFFLSFAFFNNGKPKLMLIAAVISVFGFISSLFLIYLQMAVIHSLCPYCMFSAFTSTVIFVSLTSIFFKKTESPPL